MRTTLQQSKPRVRRSKPISGLPLEREWVEVFSEPALQPFTTALREWLPSRRWFRGKARPVESVSIREQIPVPMGGKKAFLVLFQVNYAGSDSELYVLPLACAFGKKAGDVRREFPKLIVAAVALQRGRKDGVVYDAIVSKRFCRALLDLTSKRRKAAGGNGELEAEPAEALRRMRREQDRNLQPSVSKAEQSNSSVIYGDSVILKFFRRLDAGVNPELEIERFLAARSFPHSPSLAGALEYRAADGKTSTVAVLTSFVPGCHDAWEDTVAALTRFYTRVQDLPAKLRRSPPPAATSASIVDNAGLLLKPSKLIGSYLRDARTIGRRTAALHLALASDPSDPAFRPEPWTRGAQQSLFESMRTMTERDFQLLRRRAASLPPDARRLAQKVLPLESLLLRRFVRVADRPLDAVRIRTHGDYHLGQILHHGEDFLIIDFEGEPAISLEERRVRQTAFRDVAGMIYSFFYAAYAALREPALARFLAAQPKAKAAWARYWSVWVGTAFLTAYLETARSAPFIPADEASLKIMLETELLRKAVYELGYELNNRPDWIHIAFQVLLDLLDPNQPI